jgi:hypothetical protein
MHLVKRVLSELHGSTLLHTAYLSELRITAVESSEFSIVSAELTIL